MPTPRDRRNSERNAQVMPFPTLTNESVITAYLAHQQSGNRWRPRTVEVRAQQIRSLAAWLDPVTLVDATEDDILTWYATLACWRPETRAAYASAARCLYRWMATRARPRLRTDDPTLLLDRPTIPVAQPRPMPNHHYDLALACAVSQPEMYLWLGLMGCSGLRCCEIAWMHTGDVETLDTGAGLLHITGKGGKQRTVPVGAMLMLTVRPFLHGRGPVFTRVSDGRAYRPKGVSERVNNFLRGIGITETAHQLRHRFGSDYHAIDPDLYRQAKLMGHASVDTTQRYTAISPVEAAGHVETLTRRRLGVRRVA